MGLPDPAWSAPFLCILSLLLAACSGTPEGTDPGPPSEPAAGRPGQPSAGPSRSPADASRAGLPLVLFLGDSITAGYGLAGGDAFPALVEEALEERGRPARVINAGVSGDTTSGGLSRLDWLLEQDPDVVLVELGANDGLRGLPLELIEENLRRIVTRCRASGARAILAGMRVPPSYGPDYSEGFHALYARLAEDMNVPLIPFILEDVAGRPALNLPDGIHPTAEGHEILAETVLPYVERALPGKSAGR